jgi:prepilin-type N-terminal cleavage/methylation domain-containing protein
MTHRSKNAGFTLIELMIVVAIIAIIASVAIPKLMSARLSANESAAISTLRSISSAQAQLQSSSAIDTDSDGGGEYGFFAEMAGTIPMRIDGGGGVPVVGAAVTDQLNPSVLSAAFGNLVAGGAGGVVTRSGYVFQMWLPGPTAGGVTPAVGEANGGGMGAGVTDPNNCEVLWACYAWPINASQTGNRAFFINQEGDLMQTANRGAAAWTTLLGGPAFDDAYTVAGDMASPAANGVAAAGPAGAVWVPVQ